MSKALEALEALKIVLEFLSDEGHTTTCTTWRDSKGNGFDTDFGYFEEGIDGLMEYLRERVLTEPTRHGRWKHVESFVFKGVECSVCGEQLYQDTFYETDYNYCPSCGAKMDGIDLSEAADIWRKAFDADDDVPVTIAYKDEEEA